MARLKGRVWNGEAATDYLMARLDGEDGEAPWTLAEAAKRVSTKLRVKVSEQTVSKWRKRVERERREADNYEALIESSVRTLAQHAESGLQLDELVDAQIVLLIAKVHSEEGVEEAGKFINSMTALKRAITSDRDSKQGIREYDESVVNLKATIERLTAELKRLGYDPAAVDAMNARTVEEIDKVLSKQRERK